MKNPNRYGSISKLSGNRRRPYIIREGLTGTQKVIGYAATRSEAMLVLAEYNGVPWNLEIGSITMKELFLLWKKQKASKYSSHYQANLNTAFKKCLVYHNTPYKNLRTFHMQECVNIAKNSPSAQAVIRKLFYNLDKFGLELDIIKREYSRTLTSDELIHREKHIFTDEEVRLLWKHKNLPWMDAVLFMLYTGVRRSELTGILTEKVDLKQGIIVCGIKTRAGRNRTIPIHHRIMPIVEKRYKASMNGHLFESYYTNRGISDSTFYEIFKNIMKKMGLQHSPHDTRHTFRTRLDNAGANKVCIDRIMGHKSGDTGMDIYTHKTVKQLKEAVELIKC